VVLANAADDPDAAANARELLSMELEDVGSDALAGPLATFDKCLARWSRTEQAAIFVATASGKAVG